MRKKLQLLAMLLLATCGAMAQQVINGTVKSSNGEPLIGASVTVKGTNTGTNTDMDGKFSIEAPANAVLEFVYLGFISKEVSINGKTTINVTLEENAEQLSQVVVTALGISRDEKSLTYAAQQVSGEELTAVKDVNLVNSLSGKAAGVFIKKSASGVGGSAKVVLRGPSSTGNNNVLYVVDGIPMFNYSPAQPTDVWGSADGVASAGRDGGDGISNINPEDVKSISILKGASAAALYGSQAANGVILITTKRGEAGRMAINISSNFVSQSVLKGPELQFQYGQTKEGSLDSWGTKLGSPTPDFVDDFFRNGKTWINSISLSGGTETAQTYFSYANTHASGIMPTSNLNKHNFTFRETAQFLDNKLQVNANINFINQRAENRSSSGLYYNPLTGLYFFPRGLDFENYKNNFEVYSSERNINIQNWVSDKDDQQNPFWILNRNPNSNTRNRLISTVSAKFQLNDWLSVQMRGNVDKSFDAYDQRSYASTQATLAESNGRYVLQKVEGTQFYGDLMLNASKNFNDFSVNATLGSVISDNRQAVDLFDSKGANLNFANVFSLQNINQPGAIINQTLVRDQLQSVLASVNLGYKRMLYLDITGRNDWSSTLAFTGNESFFYPSVGVSGVLTEMFEMKGIDFAKIRASYAEVGSGVNAYDSYLLNNISSVDGLQTNTIGPLPGTILKPEETQSYEVGLDIRTLHNRLNFDITYYKTNTVNQRISVAAPFGSGYTRYIVNAGDIENKGIEAMVEVIPVQSKNIKWSANINFTKNNNKVLKLYEGLQDGTFFLTEAGVNNYAMVIREGGEFGDIFGRRFKRDDQGRIMVSDEGKPLPEDGGLAYIGNPNPDFMLGFNNHLSYKNFNLNFLVDGRFGGEVMSITQAMTDELGVSQATADARNSGQVPVNATAEMDPQDFYQTVGGRAGITEYYMYDATNIRLREVSLGYTLPTSLVSKWGPVKSVKFSLVGRNLFFFKNNAPFDPDISMSTGTGLQGVDVFSLPSTRSFGFNISLSL